MYNNKPILQKPYRLLLLLLVTLSVFILSAIPKDAEAQVNRRVCVNQAETLAFKIGKGSSQRVSCENTFNDVKTGNIGGAPWGTGKYMTCEDFASNYLKWEEWNPCYDMGVVSQNIFNSDYNPPNSKIYIVASIPKDSSIKGSNNRCGASSCTLSYSFSQSKDFSYSAGINVGVPSGVFGGSVSYSVGESSADGGVASFSWVGGLKPGLKLDFTGVNADSVRSLGPALFNLLKSYSKDYSYADEQAQITRGNTYFCPGVTPGGFVVLTITAPHTQANQAFFTAANSTLFENKNIGTFSTVNSIYNSYNGPAEIAKSVGLNYGFKLFTPKHYMVCGVDLKISTPRNNWRGGNDLLQWEAVTHLF